MANAFKTEIINGKDRGGNPVVNLGMCSFMYTREQNVYVVAVTRANANAMLAFTVRIKQIPSTSQTDPFHRTAVSAPSAPHHLPSHLLLTPYPKPAVHALAHQPVQVVL